MAVSVKLTSVLEVLIGFTVGSSLTLIVYIIVFLPNNSQSVWKYLNENSKNKIIQKNAVSYEEDTTIADIITAQVRVLCWVLVKDGTFDSKVTAVNNTWGKRCDKLLFFGSTTEEASPVIALGVKDGRRRLAKKTFAALTYIYKHHVDNADWFLKADDDTYIVMENLKYFLSDKDTRKAVWFGEHFKPYLSPWHYNSGGAGYVLSKEALRRFGTNVGRTQACTNANGAEDIALGYCLQTLEVKVGNSTDKYGRSRFHFDLAPNQIAGRQFDWYKYYLANPYKPGLEMMSVYPVSFHYALIHDLISLEFYFYTLRPHGVFLGFPEVNSEQR